ncbi:UNVERIFIED_CONTAM: Cellulose synthase-like protein G2 [Sesamum radiatum]|uniref:Cellulose synthase-like protein G2 n=1 Tax=Sesamum radiatum TaxID=300843 RepID=A0AAW2UB35_SESRA
MDGPSLPLNVRRLLTTNLVVNRLHMFVNGIAILALFHYRATTLVRVFRTRETPLLPYLIVLISEIVLTFLWVLHQAYKWRPVKLEVYPERLPGDEKLPPVDVFVCTADPSKEPSLGVMNTVISAMALDYPPDKLAVYLHDDGGSYVTLNAVREAWKFARFWVPFRRKYELKFPCPAAYFSAEESAHEKFTDSSEFAAEKKIMEKRYAEFQEALEKNSVNASASVSRDHPPVIEVMTDENGDSNLKEMPLLVYVAREKRPGHPHHFKGGALNVLLRVSAVISNAPYFMVLDCDMYCNDPSSVRQTMCFYLDPKVSPQIAWVQFPQKFRNLSEHDIYGGSLHHLYVGYRYFSVVEDCITSLTLHCKGWISVFLNPSRPCFLGASPTNLNDMLVQQTRWSFGLMQIGLSRFNPLIYGPLRMSILYSMCYAYIILESLYTVPFYGLAIIPPICLLYGIPLYPKVSDPYFIAFAFVFLSPRLKHVQEVVSFGDSLWTLLYELRVWMMKSGACYFFALMNAFLQKLGLHEANFSLTSKVVDDEQARRYEQGIYDFQVSPLLLAPLCSLYILNLATLILGIPRIFHEADQFFAQAFLSFFGVIVNYHLMEGMFLRKDKGRIAPSVTLLSVAISAVILCCGSLLLIH